MAGETSAQLCEASGDREDLRHGADGEYKLQVFVLHDEATKDELTGECRANKTGKGVGLCMLLRHHRGAASMYPAPSSCEGQGGGGMCSRRRTAARRWWESRRRCQWVKERERSLFWHGPLWG